jgi:hypothetical protein
MIKKEKFYHHQLKLVHSELKKLFKYKQYNEDEKRHIENLERKKRNVEKRHKFHTEKLERKEKNKCVNKVLQLLNLEYKKSYPKINTNSILDCLKTSIKIDLNNQLKLVHHELKLKIKSIWKKNSTNNSERNFNNMITSILNEENKEENNKQNKINNGKNCENNININNLPQDVYINRVGCILRYYKDNKDNNFYYILNKSNRNYLSDFGGGIKTKEDWKTGFYRELEEECPWMKEYIEMHVETEINIHYFLSKAEYNQSGIKNAKQLLILIDLYNEPEFISNFYKTNEVQELIVLNSKQLSNTFNYKKSINSGIFQLKNIVSNHLIQL